MSRVKVDIDRAAIDELLSSAPAMSHLEEVAWAIVGALREASPKESGRLSRSWSAHTGRDDAGRAVAFVSTSAPYWGMVNYGTADTSPIRYIDKAMSRSGVPYEPLPKE